MKVPKYIEKALEKRIKGANMVSEADTIIEDFINKNNIDAYWEDYGGGVEMYVNPIDSAEAIRKAIREK